MPLQAKIGITDYPWMPTTGTVFDRPPGSQPRRSLLDIFNESTAVGHWTGDTGTVRKPLSPLMLGIIGITAGVVVAVGIKGLRRARKNPEELIEYRANPSKRKRASRGRRVANA